MAHRLLTKDGTASRDHSKEYDCWHERVFQSDPEHPDEDSPWYRLVREHLVPIQGKRVLEVACGRGGFSKLLALQGAIVFGTDFSATALQIAQRKTPEDGGGGTHVDLTQADAQELPYADESFDIVISCETIEHVVDPLAALKEMARVSRHGALLYLTTPNYFNAMGLYHLYARFRHRKLSPGSDQPLDRIFLFPQVRRLLRQAGWDIACTDGTMHQFPILPGHDPIAVPTIESIRAVRRFLSPLAFHYFVMGRKRKAR